MGKLGVNLPIPEGVRARIYRLMKEDIISCRCMVAGFDKNEKARLSVISPEGEAIEVTNFDRISIGSGMPFSTIYFDQYDYSSDIGLEEGLLFSFEAKKWAEAPTGVGSKTDIILLRKKDLRKKDSRELLREKTLKEIKEIARTKGLSGYSNLRKKELIDLIESELSTSELRNKIDTIGAVMIEDDDPLLKKMEKHYRRRMEIEIESRKKLKKVIRKEIVEE